MAQTKSKTKSSTGGNGSRASGSGKSTAAKRTSSSKRTSSNGNRAKSTRVSRPRAKSRPTSQSQTAAGSVKNTAKTAGQAVGGAASKARTPLIAGGMALAGAAAGAVVRSRMTANHSRNPLARLRGVSMPKPAVKLDLDKLDLDRLKSAATRVSAYGQQASDIVAAIEKTRKKNS